MAATRRLFCAGSLVSLLSACAAFPTQGPNSLEVKPEQLPSEAGTGYLLVDLSPGNTSVLEKLGPKALGVRRQRP